MGKYKFYQELSKNAKYKRRKALKDQIQNEASTCSISNTSQTQSEDSSSINVEFVQTNVSIKSTASNGQNNTLKTNLVKWSVKNKISGVAVSGLLKILRKDDVKGLPLDSRTLLNTSRTISIGILHPGTYIHLGLERNLNNTFK